MTMPFVITHKEILLYPSTVSYSIRASGRVAAIFYTIVSVPAGARRHFFDDSDCVQVQKVWKRHIIYSLVPNCQILEFQNAKFGQDADDDDWEVWFCNKHYSGMRQQLMHHTLDAWDDCLPDLEPLTCDADQEKAMFNYVEIFCPLASFLQSLQKGIGWRPHPVPSRTQPIFCRGG